MAIAQSQLDALTMLACNGAQGFYFARPLPPEEAQKLVEGGQSVSPDAPFRDQTSADGSVDDRSTAPSTEATSGRRERSLDMVRSALQGEYRGAGRIAPERR